MRRYSAESSPGWRMRINAVEWTGYRNECPWHEAHEFRRLPRLPRLRLRKRVHTLTVESPSFEVTHARWLRRWGNWREHKRRRERRLWLGVPMYARRDGFFAITARGLAGGRR